MDPWFRCDQNFKCFGHNSFFWGHFQSLSGCASEGMQAIELRMSKFITIITMNLVTLHCVTYARLIFNKPTTSWLVVL